MAKLTLFKYVFLPVLNLAESTPSWICFIPWSAVAPLTQVSADGKSWPPSSFLSAGIWGQE